MNLLAVLNLLFLLARPADISQVEYKPVAFRLQVYPYGAYYSYPPNCPSGYYAAPEFRGYRRWGYWGPGYYGRSRYGCYPRWGVYYGPRYYQYPYGYGYGRGPYRWHRR